ncbi:MAG TPA: hypothetical protein VGH44_06770 [Candidatus Saccharimonadia bacterium]|jgi:hypothetical protein
MALPDRDALARERELDAAAREHEAAQLNRDRRHYDDFRETVAAPMPNRTYRSAVELENHSSVAEQIVRIAAVILGILLAIRFVINLFSYPRTSGFASFIYGTTNWAVQPFQYLFGHAATTSGGFFDWPALAAIVATGIIASILIALLRPRL